MSPSIAAIIPTFNEQDVLRRSVLSLAAQGYPRLTIIVVNAGNALEPDIAAEVEEIRVPSDHFWTACIHVGFERVRERGDDFVLLHNADTTLFTGTLGRLLEVAQLPMTIACSPGYIQLGDKVRLLYSHEKLFPTLLHARSRRAWTWPEEAPEEPFETAVHGGQGVLFAAGLLDSFDVDPAHFPQAKGDHDLWLSMKEKGYRLMMVPKAGAVNIRAFGMQRLSRSTRLKKLWARATAPTSNDSYRVMWNLRRKHQPLPLAVFSFSVMYPWRLIKGVVDALQPSQGAIDETTSA